MRTRREFMAGAAMMAAGAAVGFGGGKAHGPVDLHFDFFGPVKLKTMLSSDEEKDSFEIRVLAAPGPDTLVHFKLSEIRRAAGELVHMKAKISNQVQPTDKLSVYGHPEAGNMVFVTAIAPNGDSSKFWIALEDVKRVL